jgi:hypothetical protein
VDSKVTLVGEADGLRYFAEGEPGLGEQAACAFDAAADDVLVQ